MMVKEIRVNIDFIVHKQLFKYNSKTFPLGKYVKKAVKHVISKTVQYLLFT